MPTRFSKTFTLPTNITDDPILEHLLALNLDRAAAQAP